VEFKVEIFQVWKIIENDLRYGKYDILTWKIKMFITLLIIPAFVTVLAFHEPKKQVISQF